MTAPPTVAAPVRSASSSAAGPVRRHRHTLNVPATILLSLGALYTLVPVLWILIASTKTSTDLFSSPPFVPSFDGGLVANLGDLFTYREGIFLRWGLNSLIYAGVGGMLATAVAAAAGYSLAKYRYRGSATLFKLIVAAVILPPVVLAIPQYLMLAQAGFTNNYLAVLLPLLVSPYAIYLCKIYADSSVPDDLMEAARLDGASEWRIFHAVGLRMMAPAIVTVFLLQFIGIWNNFLLPSIMLTDPELYPLTLGLYGMLRVSGGQAALYSSVIVGSLLAIIPVVILFLSLQRFWRLDLMSGGVKA